MSLVVHVFLVSPARCLMVCMLLKIQGGISLLCGSSHFLLKIRLASADGEVFGLLLFVSKTLRHATPRMVCSRDPSELVPDDSWSAPKVRGLAKGTPAFLVAFCTLAVATRTQVWASTAASSPMAPWAVRWYPTKSRRSGGQRTVASGAVAECTGCFGRVRVPAAPKPPGFHTTARELQTYTLEGPGLQKHHQNSTRRPPEREEKNEFCGGRGKKRATFWAVQGKGVQGKGGVGKGGPGKGGPGKGGPGKGGPGKGGSGGTEHDQTKTLKPPKHTHTHSNTHKHTLTHTNTHKHTHTNTHKHKSKSDWPKSVWPKSVWPKSVWPKSVLAKVGFGQSRPYH